MQTPEPVKVEAIIREVSEAAILPRFRRLERHDISEKSPGDLVTTADRESEQLLSAALSELLPGSKVVGEEAAAESAQVLEAFDGEAPVWVLDPVDGTQNFVDGIPWISLINSSERVFWASASIKSGCLFAATGRCCGGFWLWLAVSLVGHGSGGLRDGRRRFPSMLGEAFQVLGGGGEQELVVGAGEAPEPEAPEAHVAF